MFFRFDVAQKERIRVREKVIYVRMSVKISNGRQNKVLFKEKLHTLRGMLKKVTGRY